MKQIFLRPSPGLKVKDPVTGTPLKAEGELKPATTYWLRRVKDGDAVRSAPETED